LSFCSLMNPTVQKILGGILHHQTKKAISFHL